MGKDSQHFEGSEMEMDGPTINLTDETGRSLPCYIEMSLEVDGQDYALLHPVDAPVEIFAWVEDEEEEETLVSIEEGEVDEIFATAQAVLAEQNLILKRTAISLTVEGDLPEVEEDEVLTLETEAATEEAEAEEYQLLAGFYHEEQEYAVYTPLDPLLLLARLGPDNKPELVSPEELAKIQPILEDQLFEELE
jgi:hypothetical protein